MLRLSLVELFLFFIPFFGFAQHVTVHLKDTNAYLKQEKRFEIVYGKTTLDYYLISARGDNVLLLEEADANQKKNWRIYKLDTGLNLQFTVEFTTSSSDSLLKYDCFEKSCIFLFRDVSQRSYDSQINADNINIYNFDIQTGRVILKKPLLPFPIKITELRNLDKIQLVIGTHNQKPMVLIYDSKSKPNPKILPGLYHKKSKLLDIMTDKKEGYGSLALFEQQPDNFRLRIKSFDFKGKIIQDNIIVDRNKKQLQDIKLSKVINHQQFFFGTQTKRVRSSLSQGFYVTRFNSDKQLDNKYYNFLDLNHFNDYLSKKRLINLRDQVQKKRIKGKDKYINTRIALYDLIYHQGKFVTVSEVYYPKYYYNSHGATPLRKNYYNYWGNRYWGNNSAQRISDYQFAGYRIKHAVIVAFDMRGNLLWDHFFDFVDLERSYLDQNIRLGFLEKKLFLIHYKDNNIRFKIVEDTSIIVDNFLYKLRLLDHHDRLIDYKENKEEMYNWHENHFVICGTHYIENLDHPNQPRKVFYVNKITLFE